MKKAERQPQKLRKPPATPAAAKGPVNPPGIGAVGQEEEAGAALDGSSKVDMMQVAKFLMETHAELKNDSRMPPGAMDDVEIPEVLLGIPQLEQLASKLGLLGVTLGVTTQTGRKSAQLETTRTQKKKE